ncbi:MAG: hypothetical protein GXO66_03675 [Euryarchaeota archaeon]|nr:hypothetical protein [Euryarchaeota archaeon]
MKGEGDVRTVLRINDGEELRAFVEELQRELPGVEVVEDGSLSPPPALGIGNISYHGVPRHREARAFRKIVRMAASRGAGEEAPARGTGAEVKIFTTPTCRFCERAVVAAAELAMGGEVGWLRIYDAVEFPELAEEYEVTAVPKVVIDDRVFIEAQTTAGEYARLIRRGLDQLR